MGGGSATAGSLYCRKIGLTLPNVASKAAMCSPVSYHSSVRTCSDAYMPSDTTADIKVSYWSSIKKSLTSMHANMQFDNAAQHVTDISISMESDAHRDAKVGLSSPQAAVHPGRRSHWELQPVVKHMHVGTCQSVPSTNVATEAGTLQVTAACERLCRCDSLAARALLT